MGSCIRVIPFVSPLTKKPESRIHCCLLQSTLQCISFQSEPFPSWDTRADTAVVPVQSVNVFLSKYHFPKHFLLCAVHWSLINMINAKQKGRRLSAEKKREREVVERHFGKKKESREPDSDLMYECNFLLELTLRL